MYATDLSIEKNVKNNKYSLVVGDTRINCSDSSDPVEHESIKLIEHILNDLDRCGDIGLKKDKSLNTNDTYCSYLIFSLQKLIFENKNEAKETEKLLRIFPIYDQCLIQTANGPPYETEQIYRLTPVREVIEKIIGKEDFEKLTSYAWGNYLNSTDEFAEKIAPKDFVLTKISKKIYNYFQKMTEQELSSCISVFYQIEKRSLFLPMALIKKLITKQQFILSIMGLGDNVTNLDGFDIQFHGAHKSNFSFFSEIASIALDYSQIDLSSKVDNLIKKHETSTVEIKSTFSKCVENKISSDILEHKALQSVVGFLNTSKGGNLIIGIDDNLNPIGIDNDKFGKNYDKFKRNFVQKIENLIGKPFLNRIQMSIEKYKNKDIFLVECEGKKLKNDFAYLLSLKDKKTREFFIRTEGKVIKLEGKDLADFLGSL